MDLTSRLTTNGEVLGTTGASLAYWDGTSLQLGTVGVRNSVTGDPLTPDTVMHIGSITKILNTVLFLQLVDDGLIALDDRVADHLPELVLGDGQALDRLTCRMLVNHSSGIDCDMLDDHGRDAERIVDLIERCVSFGQIHPPGAGPSYSNIGTVIAGYLTQRKRGESWYRLVETRLFAPLGMNHALVDPVDIPKYRASVGDLWDHAKGVSVQTSRPFLPLSFAPCGTTAMMTAHDLLTFARALANGGASPDTGARILSERMTDAMTLPTTRPAGMDAAWGLGWLIYPGDVLTHSGGGPGIASRLLVHKPTGRALVILTNCDRGDQLIRAIADPVIEAWTGEPAVSRLRSGPPSADLAPYCGLYGSHIQLVRVEAAGDGLAVRYRTILPLYDRGDVWSPPMPLVAVGDHGFASPSAMTTRDPIHLFADPGDDGRMGALFAGIRLLRRLPEDADRSVAATEAGR